MGRYQAYPEYKDSGVEWLGDIPADWSVSKLKHVASIHGRIGFRGYTVDDIVDEGEGAIVLSPSNIDGDTFDLNKKVYLSWFKYYESPEIMVNAGDILLVKTGSTYGKSAIIRALDEPMTINPQMAILKNSKVDPRYLAYLMSSSLIKAKIDISNTGSGMPTMTQENINNFPIPHPKDNLDIHIANFLDHETAKIDTLIEQQQQLIQLLKEKRQAVISHAVTKGLNPDAPMKDSGVEWLGEVPAHWVICRLKHIKSVSQNAFVDGPFGSNLKSEHFIDNGDVYVIESNFATTGEIDSSSLKTISNAHFETIKRSEATAGDIIIAKIGARFGMSSILPSLDKKSVVSGNSLKLTVNADVVTRMYAHKLLTVLKEMGAMDDGVNGSAQPALSLGELNNLLFLVPPIQEQSEIESFIQLNQDKFDVLLEKANVQVRLLQERRTALISAAVTGKIDVRNWQAPQQ